MDDTEETWNFDGCDDYIEIAEPESLWRGLVGQWPMWESRSADENLEVYHHIKYDRDTKSFYRYGVPQS